MILFFVSGLEVGRSGCRIARRQRLAAIERLGRDFASVIDAHQARGMTDLRLAELGSGYLGARIRPAGGRFGRQSLKCLTYRANQPIEGV